MRIIPAIDIIDGKCVRLSQGDYNRKKIYNEDPLDVALSFEDAGLEYLHLVDLDGAKAKHIINWNVLERLANKTSLNIDFGGGIKSDKDIDIAFNSGAKQVTGGSVAVRNPSLFEEWLNQYGSDKIILGADAKDGRIATQGWTEQSEIELTSFIDSYVQKGIEYVVSTDIAKDGMLEGPSFELYTDILNHNSDIKLIASGGIRDVKDLIKLESLGLEGAIVGKAIYEGYISIKELTSLC